MYLSEALIQSCLRRFLAPEERYYEELLSCIRIGACFERAVQTDPHEDRSAVDALYREHLPCADGAVMLIHIIFLPSKELALPMDMPREQLEGLMELLHLFRSLCEVHLFRDIGRLLIFLRSSHADAISQEELHGILTRVLRRNVDIDRMVVSEWKNNSVDLFHAYNSLIRFEEYQNFILKPARLQYVQQNAQMTIPFAEHSQHFDLLSSDIVTAMLQQKFDSNFWSNETVTLILQSAVGSVEALHRCIQTFVSSLSRCLLERRVMDSGDVAQGEMLDAVMMPGHNEQILREAIRHLLETLYEQHKTYDERVGAKRVREVCEYISTHISDYTLSVPVLSQHCGINRNLLSADFKKYTGSSLSSYLLAARVNYAKQLIADDPELSLAEIADRSGYTSLSTMYRNFQKVEGCSPGIFRDRILAGLSN